jgi:hypothetical protein
MTGEGTPAMGSGGGGFIPSSQPLCQAYIFVLR